MIFPFVLQGVILAVDEFVCHRGRPLGLWERIGHPLDTLAFLACLAFTLSFDPSATRLKIFVALGILSSLLVTKDEWEHRRACSGFESWLHALLFLLHPTVLILTGYLWWTHAPDFLFTVGTAAVGAAAFGLYQIVRAL